MSGRAWPSFLAVDPTAGGYSRGGGRSWVESVAMCLWFDEFLDARRADAVDREAAAARRRRHPGLALLKKHVLDRLRPGSLRPGHRRRGTWRRGAGQGGAAL